MTGKRIPEWMWGAVISLIITLVGIASIWGSNQQRLTTLEQRQEHQASRGDDIETHIDADDTQIAVIRDQLSFISAQLTQINAKLDAQANEHR